MSTPKKAPAAATPATKAAASATSSTVAGLRVVSRPASFRRAGYEFTGEPTEIPLADLSKEQVAQLRDEKSLVVVECEIAVEAEAAAE